MKITVLVENNSRIDNYLLAEPALSLLIEENNKKVLFDTGYSNIICQNTEKLGINLSQITHIVLSHGHNDHTGGLKYLNLQNKNIELIAHPNIFDEKIENNLSYGCPVSKETLEQSYKLQLTKSPYKISENLIFLGEIEGNTSDDIDDSALAYITDKGLFIITGCSHSGIINIINYAKKVTGISKIYGVLGGFHLIDKTEQEITEISNSLKQEGIDIIAPCHCCNLQSKIIMSKYLPIKEVCTGDIINT